jgi:predicted Zn-dependent peptidase
MRRTAIALVLGCAVIAQRAGAQGTSWVPYTEFTLDNGLHVILHVDRSVPVVAVNVWYRVGSGHEKPGRTGLAHLFEHLMFEGSKHVPEGAFDTLLEAAGGDNNGATDHDSTTYIIDAPSNALELALFLESDRMASLLDAMTPETVDGQRDVVKNERRESYESEPYGKAYLALPALLYPKGHPYSWTVIGSMARRSAASSTSRPWRAPARASRRFSPSSMRSSTDSATTRPPWPSMRALTLPDDTFTTFVERVRRVTADDVAKAAARYIQPDKMAVVVVGDREVSERPIRTLKLGPLSVISVDGILK